MLDSESVDRDALIRATCTPTIAEMASMGSLQSFPRKSLIVKEGAHGHTLFILLAGRIRIYFEQNDRRFVIGTYGPGTLFGEVALDGGPRTASVAATADVICSVVEYDDIKARMQSNPKFAMHLLAELIRRSRATTQRMKGLALESVYQRLRHLIEAEAQAENGRTVLGWSQQEIADRLGSSRDMVTKIFRELTRGGYIERARGVTYILKNLPPDW
jgi:CRP/FNR family cyclic AMP-dependent transcriptional regulator